MRTSISYGIAFSTPISGKRKLEVADRPLPAPPSRRSRYFYWRSTDLMSAWPNHSRSPKVANSRGDVAVHHNCGRHTQAQIFTSERIVAALRLVVLLERWQTPYLEPRALNARCCYELAVRGILTRCVNATVTGVDRFRGDNEDRAYADEKHGAPSRRSRGCRLRDRAQSNILNAAAALAP